MAFGNAASGMVRRAKDRRRKITGLRPLEWLEERSCPSALGLTLTPAGTALGLSLSVFVSGYAPTGGNTALGAGFPSSGGVLVSDGTGNVIHYPTDTDNQTPAGGTVGQNYGGGNADAMATINGVVYMTESGSNQTVQLNGDGTLNRVVANVGQLGIAADPANGHLIVEGGGAIYDVNPSLPYGSNTRLIATGAFDGVSVSLDGTIAYVANYGTSPSEISGYNIATGANVFNSGPIPGNVDGTAIGSGPLAGNIIGNTNGGTVVEVNLATMAQTVLASGGGRGDFATLDPNGTMLLASGTGMVRLSSSNPPPAITNFGSTALTEGAGPTTLTVNGTNFNNNAVVNFNGASLPTTFVNSTQLTALVPGSDLVEEGSASITVFNPGFGGGTSAPATLAIVDPAVQIVATPPVPQTVPTLFSTGVNAAGNPLPAGATDPHFTISAGPSGAQPAVEVTSPAAQAWVGNTATSQWISYNTVPNGGNVQIGTFTYHTSFNLTGFAPSTAKITGQVAADDQVNAILINGQPIPGFPTGGFNYAALVPFTITTGFVPGVNTLDFIVPNTSGPGGLQVQMNATAVPVVAPQAITTLFNTGVNAAGNPLLPGQTDPHFTIVAGPSGAQPAVEVTSPGALGWQGNTATSTWIAPTTTGGTGVLGSFTYQTTFDLTGLDPATARITGQASADDQITAVLLNGVNTGVTLPSFPATTPWTFFAPFSINSGFKPGINTLQFIVSNSGGVTGLQVQMSGTASPATATTAITGYAANDTGVVTLATFTDPGGPEPVSNYSATVDWGDGTPLDSTAVIVDNGNGTFSVKGHHVYAQTSPPGNPYKIKVSICHENLINNGGFEQPVVGGVGYFATIPGWTLVSGGAGVFEIQHGVVGTPFEGNQNLELNSFAPATIAQTIATIPGQTYQLHFAFAARPGTPASDNIMQVSVGGQVLATLTADGTGQSNFNWQVYTYTFTATSASTTIQFADTATNADQVGDELDAVSVCSLTTAGAAATILTPSADVSVSKTGPGVAIAGGNFNYTIVVTNNGPQNATMVALTDALPAGTTLVGQSQGGGQTFVLGSSGNTINDTIAVLPSGTSQIFTVTAKLSASAANGGTINNTAMVSTTANDTVPGNNTSTAAIQVQTRADLVLTVTASPSPVAPGGIITYTVTITNFGPSDASHVLFNDSLPIATTYVSQTQGGGPMFTLTHSGNAIGDSLLVMPAGASQTFTIMAKVKSTAANGSNLTNSAAVFSFTPDVNLANNTATTTTPVAAPGPGPVVLAPSLLPNQDNKKKKS